MSRLGDSVRRARMDKGLSQRALAAKAGASAAYICDIELGKRWPSDYRLDQIAFVLRGSLKINEVRCKTCGAIRRD